MNTTIRVSILSAILVPTLASAQTPTPAPAPAPTATPAASDEGLQDLSLQQLLDVDIGVATKGKAQTIREAPGIITLVTRQEILDSGARDLIDVLQLVPGFSFGLDVGGVVDVGVRGNWGHEGKVLMLLDGQVMNEFLYSTLQMGNELPVDQIEKIEIIRGPGSVVYGGYAELAVINIVTRGAKDLHGGTISANYGQMSGGLGQRDVGAQYGHQYLNGLDLSISAFGGDGQRSDQTFTDFNGNAYGMEGQSRLRPGMIDLGASYKGLSFRYIFDDYENSTRDGYSEVFSKNYAQYFMSNVGDLQYTRKFGSVTISPRVNVTYQKPWWTPENGEAYYNKSVRRTTAGTSVSWDATRDLNLLVGAEAYQDYAHVDGPANRVDTGFQTSFGNDTGKLSVSYTNVAGYGQVLWTGAIADFVAGARYENHSAFGSSFVPRAGITKTFGRAHFKALYSNAFRAPGIENINLNPDIKPERTTVYEAEIGYQVSDNVEVTANAFDISMKHPIVYAVLGSSAEGYFNFDDTGSTGGEIDVNAKYSWGYVHATYSMSTSAGKSDVPLYAVPGHKDFLLGMPSHKLTLNASFKMRPGVTVGPSAILIGPRYGFLTGDGTGNSTGVVGREDTTLLVNLFVNTHDVLHEGVDAGFGVYNIMNQPYDYIEPYDGGHAPLPGPTRELVGRIAYRF